MAGLFDDLKRDGSSGQSGGTGLFDDLKPESSGIARRLVGDTAISALKSAIAVPEAAVGIADLVTGGQAGKILENEGGIGFRPKEAKATLDEYLSPEQKAANAKLSQAEGFVDTATTALQNPSTIIHTGVESIAPMLAGGVVARGVMAAPGITGKVAPWVAGAVGEGAIGAGMGAESIRQQTEDGLLTGEQAGLAALSGAGTGIIGAAGAKVANKLGIGEIDTLLAGGGAGQATGKGVARRAAEGAVVEGVLQELPQSAQETALQNIALDRPWDEGLGEAAAMGLLTGSALGGIAGPLGGKPLVQPNPTAENPAPAPVPTPDPSAGAISRTAALLPAPSIAGLLPDPGQTLYGDSEGNLSPDGAARNFDREYRPTGREQGGRDFGPGMDQQTPRGELPLSGELIPAVQVPGGRQVAEPRTFEAEPVRQGIPDLRPEAVIVDSAGQAVVGRVATPEPVKAEPRRDGMEQQARPGQRTTFKQVLQRARAGQLDPMALASESGATRAQAARAIRGVQAEQQAVASVYKSVPGARKALSGLPKADAFEIVKTGNREWRIQQRQEASSADSGQRAADVRAAGDLPAAPAQVDNVEGVPALAERPAAAVPAAESGRADIPAPVQGGDVKPALTDQPTAEKPNKVAQKPAQEQPALPEILATPRKRFISKQAKAAGIKKGSPGYDAAVGRLESEYERQVDDAQAALPFEQFNALNKESPEGVNRQAWTQLRKERGIETVDAPAAPKVKPIKGADIDGDWASFSKDSGTLSVPRAEMPQIKAEHRGAMVNFLNARGVAHAEETIAADQLKPTQAEYSTKKVEAAKAFEGGDRSILISSDGHVLDGHHQWLAKRDAGEDVKVIRLDAPIRELLDTVAEFPSATQASGAAPTSSADAIINKQPSTKQQNERASSGLQDRQRAESSVSGNAALDLYAPAGVPAATAKQQAADHFRIRYEQVETGQLRSGFDHVTTPGEVAHLVAPIRKHAQETMMAVVTDSSGKVLNVIRHSKGAKASSSVERVEVVGAIAATEGASNVWLAHHHPSGDPARSMADLKMTRAIERALDGTGIDLKGHVIVAPGGKAEFFTTTETWGESINITPAARMKRIPITERVLRKRGTQETAVESPEDAKRAVLEVQAKDAVILLSTKHNPLGVIDMSAAEMRTLREGGRVNRLLKAFDSTNADAVIIKTNDKEAAANMSRFLNGVGARVLDWLTPFGTSMVEAGDRTINQEGGFYSRNSYPGSPDIRYRRNTEWQLSRAGQLRLQIARLTGGWQNAPDIKVVQSIKDLPDAQRRKIERDGAFDVEGMFADGQVYLVADNLRDVKHAAFVLQHEVLGHAGLQGAYGKRLTPLLMSIYNSNAELKSQADALVQRFGYQPAVAMEEVLADMAAAGTIQEQAFWPRLLTAMRNALRSIGLQVNWSDGDVQGLLANARRYIRSGTRKGRGRSVYSRNGSSGRLVEMVDEKGRLLAPNGKPSKLNQKQWHQVRSQNFKRWFGDWQAVNAQERLDAVQPLKLRMPEGWKGLTERERLAKVETSLKSMAKLSEPLPHDDLGEVVMGMSGAKKSASSAADPAKQAILSRLQSAFEHSIYASSTLSTQNGQTAAYHKLLAPIDVDGVPLVAVFTVREDVNGRMFYNTVTVDRKEDALAVSPGDMSQAQGSLPANTKALDTFVRQPLKRVNPADVSKVIDANGEPLVLYHGTAEQFNVFDQTRAGRSTGHMTAPLGIFLTNDGALAKAYAEKATDGMPGLANVMPLFVSIKKPYRMSLAESQDVDTFDKAIALRQKLEREGYDGVQLGSTGTWVAFYNSQVKSATNNTGAFDEVDPDIRYSRASQRDTEALRKLGLAGTDAQNLLDQVRNATLGGLQAKLSEWATRSEEGLFDGLAGIRRAEEAVGITDADKQGYVSARMASGIADVMHGVLHYAAPEWRDGVIAGKADTRGVLDILGDLGQDNLTPWLAWLGGKRAQMLKAQGRENNLTDADIAELIAMGNGKEALFEKVYQDYAKVNEAVLDLAEQAGLIDQSARAKWATEYYVPFYRVDESEGLFSGPRSKKGLSHQSAAIKALKGGTLPTNDLLTNMLQGWTKRIDASMKNKALMEVVDNLQGSEYLTDESPRYQQVLISRSQIADQIRKDRKALAMAAEMLGLPAESKFLKVANQLMKPENEGFEQLWTRVAPTDPDIIRLQRGGKNEYYRVNDESLLRGLKFMEGSVFNDPITRIGRTFKRLLTTGVTASPDFILRNFIRDAAHAWMINKDGFVLGKDSIKGMRDALREDQDYRDLMFAGGSFQGGYVHGTDPEASAQIIRRALEKKGFTSEQQSAYMGSLVNTPAKVAGMLGKGWQAYRTLGDKVENANRLSTYKAALAAGKSPRQAAYEAKDLMDYSLRGNFAAAQWFTDVVPFLNARLQGLYKLGRAVRGDKTLIAKEVAMKGGYIALFSLMLAGLNDDDERYQALMDWDKDMHWHIFLGDQHFRIPKPFELGLIFGTVPERLLHTLTGTQDGGDLAKAVSQGVFQTLAFNPVPQFYQPIRELQANRNFFRDSPIEDMSDEGKLPEARFDERTSALGRMLGQVTGPTLGLSPKQLDHLVQGYTGTLGGYVLGMSSLIASAFDGVDSPTARASDLPVLKVLYQGDAVRSTQYQSQFYDMMQEADQLHRTVKAYRDEGKVEAAAKLLEGNSDKLKHRAALGLARQQLGAVRRQMDAVYRNEQMDGDAKRQRLTELQQRSNQIAERVVRLAEKDF